MLRTRWFRHIPDLTEPGAPPEDALSANPEIEIAVSKASRDDPAPIVSVDVHPGRHLFHETVFTVHKAVRVFCLAASQVEVGSVTWSISTGYQAAILAARGLIGLCGVAYVPVPSGCLVDVFPGAPKGQRGNKGKAHDIDGSIQVISVGHVGNQEWWKIYQRILRTSRFPCWRYPVDERLKRLDGKRWGRHRNELHYGAPWYYGDLLSNTIDPGFGAYTEENVRTELVDRLTAPEGSDGTLLLAEVLLGNTLSMLSDLAADVPIVRREYATMLQTIANHGNGMVRDWVDVLDP